jgi:hypothetical protein
VKKAITMMTGDTLPSSAARFSEPTSLFKDILLNTTHEDYAFALMRFG